MTKQTQATRHAAYLRTLSLSELIKHGQEVVLHSFEMPSNDGKRTKIRWVKVNDGQRIAVPARWKTLAQLEKVNKVKEEDRRSRSIKYDLSNGVDNRCVVEATDERLSVVEAYAADADADREISYAVNEDKLYKNQMAFFAAMPHDMLVELFEDDDEIDL